MCKEQINLKNPHIENDYKITGIHTSEILHLQEKGRILYLLEALEVNRIAQNSAHIVLNDQIDLSSQTTT